MNCEEEHHYYSWDEDNEVIKVFMILVELAKQLYKIYGKIIQ